MTRNILLSLLAVFCLAACTSTEPDNGGNGEMGRKTQFPSFRLKSNTVYFGGEYEQFVSVVDTNTLVIAEKTPEGLLPKEGEVVFVPYSSKNPSGFMGRVTTVTKSAGAMTVETEACALEDVFEELHLDEEVSVSQYMDSVEDEDGNLVACELLPDDIWEDTQAAMDSLANLSGEQASSKAALQNSASYTRIIPFKYEGITGKVILSASVAVKIDISDGKLTDYNIVLKKKSFISVHAEASLEKEIKKKLIPLKTFRIPAYIPVGPIVLRPAVLCSLDFFSSGNVKIGANIGVGVDEVTNRWHNGVKTTTFGDNNPNYVSAYYLDAEGKIGLEGRIALQLGVFGQKLLAFGIDAIPKVTVGLSGKIDMDNKDLLKTDLEANLTLGGSLGIYLYCKLLSSQWENLRTSIELPSKTWSLDLLDSGEGLKVTKESGTWRAHGDFAGKQFMKLDEEGFALFRLDQDEPVDLKAVMKGKTPSTKAGMDIDEVSFTIKGDPSQYYVCPYNKVGAYCFYGNGIQKLIKRIKKSSDEYSLSYDGQGRLVKVETNGGDTWTYAYSKNCVLFESRFDVVTGYLNDDGLLLTVLDAYNDGEMHNTTTSTLSYDEFLNPSLNSKWQYSGGNHVSSGEKNSYWRAYEYGTQADNLNLDLFHFVIDETGLELIPLVSFPHIHNRNLCTAILNYDKDKLEDRFNLSYTLDKDGDVITILLDNEPWVELTY